MSSSQQRFIVFFLDANVMISASWKQNAEVARIWQLENVRLVTSIYVMAEVQRNLPKIEQIERLRRLMTSVEVLLFPESVLGIPEVEALPLKDRPVLSGAVHAKADFFITGDKKHFGQWFGTIIAGVKVESPSSLLTHFHLRSG